MKKCGKEAIFAKKFRRCASEKRCGKIKVMAYIRKYETGSGATGVQVCYKEQGRVIKTVHVGSAKSEVGLVKLMKRAQEIIDQDKNPLFNLGKFDKK